MNTDEIPPPPRRPHADTVLKQLGLENECSEVGNMHRFVRQHKGHLLYTPERKSWRQWHQSCWHPCDRSVIFSAALDTAKSIYDEARDCPNEEGRKRLTNWALQSQMDSRLNAMITMASKHPEMVASIEKFDTKPKHLNCRNGTVNLETGALQKSNPSQLIAKVTAVPFHKDATCPRFKTFLMEVFGDDEELLDWFQRAVGYTLTGLTSEQVFFIAYGTGANGKSTLFETLLDVLGDYGRSSEFDTFLATDRGNTRALEGIAKLQGIRFALASETDSARRFSEALVKKITGGDTVTGTFLYGSSFEFRPNFKLWLLANHLPIAKDGSHGFWRRVKVIPFARQFSNLDRDQTLPEILMKEAPGILSWCVQGSMRWFEALQRSSGQTGLGDCHAVDEATAVYKSDHDLFGKFITDHLIESPGEMVPAKDLYQTYQDWSLLNGEKHIVSQVIFASRLEERNIRKKRKSSGNVYLNYKLRALYSDF